jgi:hypothetical protein
LVCIEENDIKGVGIMLKACALRPKEPPSQGGAASICDAEALRGRIWNRADIEAGMSIENSR